MMNEKKKLRLSLCFVAISFLKGVPQSLGYVIPESLLRHRRLSMPVSFNARRNDFKKNSQNPKSYDRQEQFTLFSSNNNSNKKRHYIIEQMQDEIEPINTKGENKNNAYDKYYFKGSDRRTFFQRLGFASIFTLKDAANARGLVKVPCNYDLANTYHFLRAGQSLLEEEDILSTNPLFL